MSKLRWWLSPEDFVLKLQQLRSSWKRRGGGRRTARRHAQELARRRLAWYRRVTGVYQLPKIAVAAGHDEGWSSPPPEALRIVIAQGSPTLAGDTRSRSEARRQLRRGLATRGAGVMELLASRREDKPRRPTVAIGRRDGHKVVRGVFLEALGAAVVPELSQAQESALKASGAVILSNDQVGLVHPTGAAATATPLPDAWHLDSIRIEAARAKNLAGRGCLIGVLDTGIDAQHPEFRGKSIAFRSFKPNGSPNKTVRAKDYDAHGTHVSALCAGETVGVAPKADLAVAAVLTRRDSQGRMWGFRAQILAGLNWLASGGDGLPRRVDVLNASLGGVPDRDDYDLYSDFRVRGLTVVAAIGNNGRHGVDTHGAPGMYECALAVGAVDRTDIVTDFSAWGAIYGAPPPGLKPDLVAPGHEVISAVPGARYAAMTGTSMASPLVAGTVALLIEQNPGLRSDPDWLIGRILSLTRPLPTQPNMVNIERSGNGVLDLATI